MEQIQATFTIVITREQLLQLLVGASPEVVIVPVPDPAPVQQAPAPAPVQQAPAPAPAPAPMPVQQAPAIPVRTAPQTYTVQDLMLAARPLAENGKKQELLALLAEFGVPAVTNIPENRRADFAARLRAIGGQI